MQAEAEHVLRAIEDRAQDVERPLAGLDPTFLASSELSGRLKRAYEEGMASGPGREVGVETLIAEFKERARDRG